LITLAMLGAMAAAITRRRGLSGVSLAAGLALKPQALVIAPALLLATAWKSGARGVAWWAAGAAAGMALVAAFFVLNGEGGELSETYRRLSGYQDHLSYNAWNIWWPAEIGQNPQPSDNVGDIGGMAISFRLLAILAFAPAAAVLITYQYRHRESTDLFIAATFSVLSFFMLATAVHERYLVYALGLLAPVVVLDRRWAAMYAALSVTVLLNVSASLPPFAEWGDLANGAAFSLMMTSLNVGLYVAFAGLMLMKPQETESASISPVMSLQPSRE
jgi:hypothetical protein